VLEDAGVARSTVHLPIAGDWLAKGQEPLSAARVGSFVFTSGVPGIDPKTGRLASNADAQCAQAFDNLLALLDKADAGPQSVGLLTAFVSGDEARAPIEGAWRALYPGTDRPARKIDRVPLPEGEIMQLMAVCVTGETRVPIVISGLSRDEPVPTGVRFGSALFSSAIVPDDPTDGTRAAGAPAQIDRVFANMRLFMETAGGSAAGINHVWISMKDFRFQPRMVDRWVADFPATGDRPARKTLPCDLAGGIEIEARLTGYLGGGRRNYEIPGVGHEDPIPMASSIGPLLQSSGLYGIDPATGRAVDGLGPQLRCALGNLGVLLRRAGTAPDRVAHLTIMVRDLADAPAIAAALAALFPDPDAAPALKFMKYTMREPWCVQLHATAIML
jgi:2-iminobutanoate/2-iminopropanoate deaminase